MRKILTISTVLGILGLLLVSSCKKDPSTFKVDMGYNYYPLETGSWIVYDVDSIAHDDFSDDIDTFHYQVKELIESQIIDNTGDVAYRLERYKRVDSTFNWVLRDVWTMKRSDILAEKVEENERFLKLAFPVNEDQEWDGNSLNSREEWTHKYEDIDKPKIVGGYTLDSTLTVVQRIHFDPILETTYAIEVYARDIGLVYREWNSLFDVNYVDSVDALIPLIDRVDEGFEYTATLNSYGK